MFANNKILAVVPARSGSKGIPDKNMRTLRGISLIGRAGDCLASLPWLDARIISTDSRSYAEEGARHGLEAPFLRPPELSGDRAGAVETLIHALLQAEAHYGATYDVILIIEPTSPLRRPQDIETCVQLLVNSPADSVVTVSPLPGKFHPAKILSITDGTLRYHHPEGKAVVARQALHTLYWRNGVCYALKRNCLVEKKSIFTDSTVPVVLDREVVNIDDPMELQWAEVLLGKQPRERSERKRMTKRKIAVILVDRANYGRLKPVMEEMRARPEIDLQVICAGTMLLDRFGRARDIVAKDGFDIAAEVYMELEGSVPETMAHSIGLGVIQFSNAFMRLKPDFVLLIGDRYEALGAAIASAFHNICLIHLQGGEVTGSIDESTRHAITKLAHYHFPATQRAGKYVIAMGEEPGTVFPLGCPSADVVAHAARNVSEDALDKLGVGKHIDLSRPYLLVLFHPVTTEFASAESQMQAVLDSIKEIGMQTILLWPNIDAGSDGISQAIRRFREYNRDIPLHAYKNFEPELYIPILDRAACALGNSSSFVRDASFLGTPVVLVGSRQDGREWCEAVRRVEPVKEEILIAVQGQLQHGKYSVSQLYGSPGVSQKITDGLLKLKPYSQKRLAYAQSPANKAKA